MSLCQCCSMSHTFTDTRWFENSPTTWSTTLCKRHTLRIMLPCSNFLVVLGLLHVLCITADIGTYNWHIFFVYSTCLLSKIMSENHMKWLYELWCWSFLVMLQTLAPSWSSMRTTTSAWRRRVPAQLRWPLAILVPKSSSFVGPPNRASSVSISSSVSGPQRLKTGWKFSSLNVMKVVTFNTGSARMRPSLV